MKDPKERNEFSCTDDSPLNNGYGYNQIDPDEVRPRSLRFNDDEIDEDGGEDDFAGNYEGEGI